MSIIALGISTVYIALTCLIANAARKLILKFINNDFVKELFFEAIAAAELCGCCFELIIVADNFGVATYAIYLFMLTIYWCQVWGDATACPYTHMEDMIEGKTTPKSVALKTWAQLMGGCCVFRYVQLYWWLEVTSNHEGRAFEECKADLQVSPYYGALVECVATLLCRLASRAIAEVGPTKYATAIDSFVGTSLVVAAFNYSGGYFNPVLATALKWGCSGHTNFEHIIVYWIGACVGACLSVPIFKLSVFQNLIMSSSSTPAEKPKTE